MVQALTSFSLKHWRGENGFLPSVLLTLLGFHGYQLNAYLESVDPGEEEEKDRAAFRARGVSQAFLAQVFTAAPDEMWFPNRGGLFQAGVTTKP